MKQTLGKDGWGRLIGRSPAMRKLFFELESIAKTDVTVLIRGESGTGKEVAARSLHEQGRRRDKPFVVAHCASIPETLFESELFGHERGAFTGAVSRQAGLVESAHQGTLFLDEIGDLPLSIQPKLLRVLQDRRLSKLGGSKDLAIDIRVMAATQKPLERMALRDRTFRKDLFYRLNVIPIRIPPLRERTEDIPLLLEHFLDLYSKKEGLPEAPPLPTKVYSLFRDYSWPGNIRELENAVQRYLALSPKNFETFLMPGISYEIPAAHFPVGEVVDRMIRDLR